MSPYFCLLLFTVDRTIWPDWSTSPKKNIKYLKLYVEQFYILASGKRTVLEETHANYAIVFFGYKTPLPTSCHFCRQALSPKSESDSIMPCDVKSSFKTGFQISLYRSIISILTKTCFGDHFFLNLNSVPVPAHKRREIRKMHR